MTPTTFTFHPIGTLRSPHRQRIDAPHQATVEGGVAGQATLELDPGLPEETLRDLEGFAYVWVIFAFHKSEGWAPTVKPPGGPGSSGACSPPGPPHRPNAIGLSAVELRGVEGRTLLLGDVDLLDGTPVLDIKPYVPYADAFPDARAGWIDAVDEATGLRSVPGLRRPREPREG